MPNRSSSHFECFETTPSPKLRRHPLSDAAFFDSYKWSSHTTRIEYDAVAVCLLHLLSLLKRGVKDRQDHVDNQSSPVNDGISELRMVMERSSVFVDRFYSHGRGTADILFGLSSQRTVP